MDSRFKHIGQDPRFRRMKREHRKVKIDNRFKAMFEDPKFKLKYMVDKRGKPMNLTTNENLQKYYELSDSNNEDVSDSEGTNNSDESETEDKSDTESVDKLDTGSVDKLDTGSVVKSDTESERSDTDESKSSEDESEAQPFDQGPDLARGEGNESSSDDSEEEFEFEEDDFDHEWNETKTESTSDPTRRLALCSMDWDHIKINDIMVLLNSFRPTDGFIHSITIYPSEFGLKEMAHEESLGPSSLVKSLDKVQGEQYHREKLRRYQMKRLQYFYAVIECDSPKTANHIYENCDGIEFEATSNRLDLRFIPDDVEFDQTPKECLKNNGDISSYKPSKYVTTALSQSKVELTWDETDPDRVALTNKKFTKEELEEMDVKNYLASDSDDDSIAEKSHNPVDDENNSNESHNSIVNKYRSLLNDSTIPNEDKTNTEGEISITWNQDLTESTTKIVKNKLKGKGQTTPWEKYLQKKKEKRELKKKEKENKIKESDICIEEQIDDLPPSINIDDPFFKEEIESRKKSVEKSNKKRRKAKDKIPDVDKESDDYHKLSLLVMDNSDKQHFNMDEILQRGKKKSDKNSNNQSHSETTDNFVIDVKDSRFENLYSNPHYSIDPTAPAFKRTEALDALIEEKLRRHSKLNRKTKTKNISKDTNLPSDSINSLVKSVKVKTENYNLKKKKRLK